MGKLTGKTMKVIYRNNPDEVLEVYSVPVRKEYQYHWYFDYADGSGYVQCEYCTPYMEPEENALDRARRMWKGVGIKDAHISCELAKPKPFSAEWHKLQDVIDAYEQHITDTAAAHAREVEEKDKKIEELVLKIESQGEINQSLISEIARLKDELNEERCSIKETLAIRDSELVSIKKLLDDQTKTLLEELDKTAKLTSELSALKATAWTEKLVWKFSRYVWTCLSNGVAPDEPSAWLASRKAEKGRA